MKGNIEEILGYYLAERVNKHNAQKNTCFKSREHFNFFSSFFGGKSFTQKCNAVNALQSALKGEPVDLQAHLNTLQNGELGKRLKDWIKRVKIQGLTKINPSNTTPLRTIKDFIMALEKHNKSNNTQLSSTKL